MANIVSTIVTNVIMHNSGFVRGAKQNTKVLNETAAAADKVARKGKQAKSAQQELVSAFVQGHLTARALIKTMESMASVIADTVKTWAAFDQQMSAVKAVVQGSSLEMQGLTDQAKKLGATTVFTAAEVAKAQELLAKAGKNTNEILGMTPAIMDAAAAAGKGIAETASTLINVMSSMQISTDKAAQTVDQLAVAALNTKSEITDYGVAMSYVGPVAKQLGIRVEELTAAIGLMRNAGLDASTAGTALRGALTRVMTVSGKAREAMNKLGITAELVANEGLAGMVSELQLAITSMNNVEAATLVMEAFGQRAGPGLAGLVGQGSFALQELINKIDDADGASRRMAEIRLDNVAGDVVKIKSAWDGVKIALGAVVDGPLRSFAKRVLMVFNHIQASIEMMNVASGESARQKMSGGATNYADFKRNLEAKKKELEELEGGRRSTFSAVGAAVGGAAGGAVAGPGGAAVGILGGAGISQGLDSLISVLDRFTPNTLRSDYAARREKLVNEIAAMELEKPFWETGQSTIDRVGGVSPAANEDMYPQSRIGGFSLAATGEDPDKAKEDADKAYKAREAAARRFFGIRDQVASAMREEEQEALRVRIDLEGEVMDSIRESAAEELKAIGITKDTTYITATQEQQLQKILNKHKDITDKYAEQNAEAVKLTGAEDKRARAAEKAAKREKERQRQQYENIAYSAMSGSASGVAGGMLQMAGAGVAMSVGLPPKAGAAMAEFLGNLEAIATATEILTAQFEIMFAALDILLLPLSIIQDPLLELANIVKVNLRAFKDMAKGVIGAEGKITEFAESLGLRTPTKDKDERNLGAVTSSKNASETYSQKKRREAEDAVFFAKSELKMAEDKYRAAKKNTEKYEFGGILYGETVSTLGAALVGAQGAENTAGKDVLKARAEYEQAQRDLVAAKQNEKNASQAAADANNKTAESAKKLNDELRGLSTSFRLRRRLAYATTEVPNARQGSSGVHLA